MGPGRVREADLVGLGKGLGGRDAGAGGVSPAVRCRVREFWRVKY